MGHSNGRGSPVTRFVARGLAWVALGWSVGGLMAATMHGSGAHVIVFALLTGASGLHLWPVAGER